MDILLHEKFGIKRFKTHSSWNGDVWKSIVQSRTFDTYTIKADQGLGLILKRKNRDKLVHPINNFKNLKFKDYYNHHEKFMRLIDENKVLETIVKKTNNLIKVVGLINNLNIIYLDLELFVNMVLRFPSIRIDFFCFLICNFGNYNNIISWLPICRCCNFMFCSSLHRVYCS